MHTIEAVLRNLMYLAGVVSAVEMGIQLSRPAGPPVVVQLIVVSEAASAATALQVSHTKGAP